MQIHVGKSFWKAAIIVLRDQCQPHIDN